MRDNTCSRCEYRHRRNFQDPCDKCFHTLDHPYFIPIINNCSDCLWNHYIGAEEKPCDDCYHVEGRPYFKAYNIPIPSKPLDQAKKAVIKTCECIEDNYRNDYVLLTCQINEFLKRTCTDKNFVRLIDIKYSIIQNGSHVQKYALIIYEMME